MAIHYDTAPTGLSSGFSAQQNGNIAAISWKSGTDHQESLYAYAYDYLDRLKLADLFEWNTSLSSFQGTEAYMGDYSYDERGNITGLSRKGSQATFTDALFYTYENGTNKIKSIADFGSSEGFSDDGVSPGAQYDYDANGNLIGDPYKNLDIAYNHLNLPDTIIQPGSNNRIVYLYDAAGNKLRKDVLNDSLFLTGPFTKNSRLLNFEIT